MTLTSPAPADPSQKDAAPDTTQPYAIRLPAVDGAPAVDVRVATPQGERPTGGWPVLVLLEGEAFFDTAAQVSGRLLRRSAKTRVEAMMTAGVSLSGVADRVAAYAFTPGPQGQASEPQGAALLADGLAGGRCADLVASLQLRGAAGTVLDHLYIQDAAALRRRYLG